MAGASTDEVQKTEPDTEKQQQQNDSTTTTTTTKDGAVTEITPECLIKHPLQHQWTLWYLEPDRTKSWEEMQNEVSSFDTVEDFWSLYNHIKGASEIKQGSDYSLFKKNIRPMWEDEGNKRGGRWIMSFPRTNRRQELDSLWLDVVLCLIGEAFDYPDDICGAVVNVRPRGDKIAVWTANGLNEQGILSIGHKLKECLRLAPENQIGYELHKDTANKGKATYVI